MHRDVVTVHSGDEVERRLRSMHEHERNGGLDGGATGVNVFEAPTR